MLHLAPEKEFSRRLKKIPELMYVTADLSDIDVMVRMNLEKAPYPNELFDIIYCSHVLEHVDNDRIALKELYRILRRGGWALILVPITSQKTFEDPSVSSPEERLLIFGQVDHVRRYGMDFEERLREAGFSVKSITEAEVVGESRRNEFGVTDDPLFICRK